jgi:Tfp pilus assembly protein PilV
LKKFLLIGSLVAVVVAMLALPALAQNHNNNNRFGNDPNQRNQQHAAARFANFLDNFSSNNDHWWNNNHWWDNNDPVVSQSNEQNVESGDAKQSINVTGGGDNSNQCVGVQGITNTGNATNNTSVLQYGTNGAGVRVQDSGNFTISPSQTTTCDQRVNQAASASGW